MPARAVAVDRPHAVDADGLTPADRLYTCLPLFHGNALNYSTLTALWGRATIALETRFSASRFWKDIHKYRGTQFNAMMIVTTILEKLPVTPEETDNPVRIAVLVPPPANRRAARGALGHRDHVAVRAVGGVPGDGARRPARPTTSRARRAASPTTSSVRIVDENDCEVPRGTAGEVILRTREPWTMLTEYYGKPEATARVFRNLWFHTGDRAVSRRRRLPLLSSTA